MPDNHETPAAMPLPALRLKLLAVSLLITGLAPTAWALGLEPPRVNSRLGQALDMSFPLNLAVNEAVSEQCLKADVQAGDARIPAGLLQLRIEGEMTSLRVRLTSLVRIEESPVQVSLAIGCPSRLTRDFVAVVEAGPAVPPLAAAPATAPPLPTAKPAPSPRPPAPDRRAEANSAESPATKPSVAAGPGAKSRPASSPAARVSRAPAPQPRLRLDAPEILVPPVVAASAAEDPADLEQVLARLEAQVAALQAEIKAQRDVELQAASAPVPVVRASAVEAEAIPEVKRPAARAQRFARYADPMTWLWTLGLMLIAGGWAYTWSERQDRRRRRAWAAERARSATGAAPPAQAGAAPDAPERAAPPPAEGPISAFAPAVDSAPVPLPDEGQARRPRAMPWPQGAGAAAPSTFQASHLETQPLERRLPPSPAPAPAAPAATPSIPPRPAVARTGGAEVPMAAVPSTPAAPVAAPVAPPVTIPSALPSAPVASPAAASGPAADPMAAGVDALLELQQQADFLALLGQHDAMADLLAARVNQGMGGPMPYLMLMELCQQRGEAEAFMELARRFEGRFGTLAPNWQHSIGRGRSLDASASVIAHLQVVWADPAAALRMLIELIVRGAGPGAPSFDLPAYRDLLALYAVARDLYEVSLRSTGGVDVEF